MSHIDVRHVDARQGTRGAGNAPTELRGEGSTGTRLAATPPAAAHHRFESEREGEAVQQTTPDLETPIFQELNKELGELPEIDIHDFDEHAFDFLREYDAETKSDDDEASVTTIAEEPVAAAAGSGSRRGRRRKGD